MTDATHTEWWLLNTPCTHTSMENDNWILYTYRRMAALQTVLQHAMKLGNRYNLPLFAGRRFVWWKVRKLTWKTNDGLTLSQSATIEYRNHKLLVINIGEYCSPIVRQRNACIGVYFIYQRDLTKWRNLMKQKKKKAYRHNIDKDLSNGV